MKFLRRLLSNSSVESRYVRAGAAFGDAVSYLYLGECAGFDFLFDNWASWEEEYSHRGFRTVSLDRFVELGGYGRPINDVIRKKLEKNEKPIYHAEIYRENFLGKFAPLLDLERLAEEGGMMSGRYELPSTKKANKSKI